MSCAETTSYAEVLTPTVERYTAASKLDPLMLDAFFLDLPSINRSGDVAALYGAMCVAVSQLQEVSLTSTDAALASLRDLDFLASSYVRHGKNPVEEIHGLEDVLIRLGSILGTVPRGTVTTYALANPKGERQRSFTGDTEESLFIEAVRQTSFALEGSLQEFIDKDAKSALEGFATNLDTAVDSIVSIMRTLPPEYFTNEMRPYFDPITIGGNKYLGAGGAQLQFVAFDYVLWGASEKDAVYTRYFNENYNYLTPFQQNAIAEIVAKYDQKTILMHIATNNDKETAQAALDALKKMKKFRYPHRKLAQENFKVRREGEVGSGSYTTDILDVLLEKTEQAIEAAERVLDEK